MPREVRTDVETLRAADIDRQKIAEQLKAALDEGRLSLHEYDDRVREAYGASTYKELLLLVSDLPRPGLSAEEVRAEARRKARKLPTAIMVLWTIWSAFAAVNLVVFGILVATVDSYIYPWPVWLLVPAAALGVATLGTQTIRAQQRRR
ncbi:DUF1707 domain-containing protein [Actinoplanes sp. TBRC 11911]|uniref:DUF1707 SHOCT-like domain-containing protein n=1 Tax=Actinoplanes sp. TBRC 11911 TaxID=2729386 RepID=UPI00145F99F3|nr:DUF1707 domain-containing protein [Actinoplanes sp. TBRC 11911]NMO56566.1 DUF1707 domain-containing protein [Actinoplanes sp. TBRC 11911]